MEELVIERVLPNEELLPLLLLADPSERQLKSYLHRGIIYVAKRLEGVIGVYVLLETRPNTMEVMNIAVCNKEQGKGVGKQLLQHAILTAKKQGMHTLEIGTGNSSVSQLALYQKCGFRIFSIDFDYFSKHYEEEIMENGIVCRDMIRLTMDLQ
ncbi:GNAT family N-acetyltransferase [Bacillus cytotoxicus]|uniref:GNAT family N-acetyltransferase n=1 Tax=Bacillus cytotoxicus TaxID=580165 RepID=A0ACC6ACZ7_9BACI|nr:GNAT family N-acetyltransferase [Bacillus cytotoxicus]